MNIKCKVRKIRKLNFVILILILLCSCSHNENNEIIIEDIDTIKLNSIIDSIDVSETINIVLISRETCDSCVVLNPLIEDAFKTISEKYVSGDVMYLFYKYDTDENRNNKDFTMTMENLGVNYVPTILILNGVNDNISVIDEENIINDKNLLLEKLLEY